MIGNKWKSFFFDKFPSWYRENDTYKNENSEGLLERFLRVFGTYIYDLEESIDNWLTHTRDLEYCEPEFLPTIAKELGSPPNILGDTLGLRKTLLSIVSIYKIKGTLESYQVLFQQLGYNIEIVYEPFIPSYWDQITNNSELEGYNPLQLLEYGMVPEYILWDEFNWDDVCQTCVYYTILISDINDDPVGLEYNPISEEILLELLELVEFVEPIDGILLGLNPVINIEETVDGYTTEEITILCYEFSIWDVINWDEFDWDEAEEVCNELIEEENAGEFNQDFNEDFNIV